MKETIFYICLLIAGAVLCFTIRSRMLPPPAQEIEYQGERFKLTRTYSDYDDYKNDPENIDPSENARIERAVTGAKLALEYPSEDEMLRAVFALNFPGYGLSSFFVENPQPDGTSLAAFSVEVPRAGKDRVVVFRSRGTVYTLIDDFVKAADPGITRVRLVGGRLLYGTPGDEQVLVRPLAGN